MCIFIGFWITLHVSIATGFQFFLWNWNMTLCADILFTFICWLAPLQMNQSFAVFYMTILKSCSAAESFRVKLLLGVNLQPWLSSYLAKTKHCMTFQSFLVLCFLDIVIPITCAWFNFMSLPDRKQNHKPVLTNIWRRDQHETQAQPNSATLWVNC